MEFLWDEPGGADDAMEVNEASTAPNLVPPPWRAPQALPPPPPSNQWAYSSASSSSTPQGTHSKAGVPPPPPKAPPPHESLRQRPEPAPPSPPDGPWTPVPMNQRHPSRLRDEDVRFEKSRKGGTIWCDRCTNAVPYKSQSYPHDGDYQFSKQGIASMHHKQLWEAGQDFTWYCIRCLAISLGKTDVHRQATLDTVREERGLLDRGRRRFQRVTKTKQNRIPY